MAQIDKIYAQLVGKTLANVEKFGDEMRFTFKDGSRWYMCMPARGAGADGWIEDVSGTFSGLYGSPLFSAMRETAKNEADYFRSYRTEDIDSFTWTSFSLVTEDLKYVRIMWLSFSNGEHPENEEVVFYDEASLLPDSDRVVCEL
jgi:hypothetical protein